MIISNAIRRPKLAACWFIRAWRLANLHTIPTTTGTQTLSRILSLSLSLTLTLGTTLLNTSRARRNDRVRKVMHHAPEVVRAVPDDKLSPFAPIRSTGAAKFGFGFESGLGFKIYGRCSRWAVRPVIRKGCPVCRGLVVQPRAGSVF